MNKRKLISQNEELYNLVREAEIKNETLKKRIDELSIMLGAKDFEINELKQEIENIKNIKPEEPKLYSIKAEDGEVLELDIVPNEEEIPQELEEVTVKPIEPQESHCEEKQEEKEAKQELKKQEDLKSVLKDEISKYAAKAISNISLKTAMLSNFFAEQGNANAKDLLTLTFGRAEIFKQKVFECTKNSIDFDNAKATINLLEAEVLEYFEQLKAQIK